VDVDEVRWKEGGTVRAQDFTSVYGKERKNNWEQDFVCNTE
jgi:hypothetical protein